MPSKLTGAQANKKTGAQDGPMSSSTLYTRCGLKSNISPPASEDGNLDTGAHPAQIERPRTSVRFALIMPSTPHDSDFWKERNFNTLDLVSAASGWSNAISSLNGQWGRVSEGGCGVEWSGPAPLVAAPQLDRTSGGKSEPLQRRLAEGSKAPRDVESCAQITEAQVFPTMRLCFEASTPSEIQFSG